MSWFWFFTTVLFAYLWLDRFSARQRKIMRSIENEPDDGAFLKRLATAMGDEWDYRRRPLQITNAIWHRLNDINARADDYNPEQYPLLRNAAKRFDDALAIAQNPISEPSKGDKPHLNAPTEFGPGIANYLITQFYNLAVHLDAYKCPSDEGERIWKVKPTYLISFRDNRYESRDQNRDG